jgi:hypothetical protein
MHKVRQLYPTQGAPQAPYIKGPLAHCCPTASSSLTAWGEAAKTITQPDRCMIVVDAE